MRTVARLAVAVLVALGIGSCRDAPDGAVPTQPTDPHAAREVDPSQFAPGYTVGLQLVAQGLTSPLQFAEVPDGSGRLFVADQMGLVRIILPGGSLHPEPFLDVRSRMVALSPGSDERGLLGLAFHPQYASNGRFFVYYSAPRRPGAPSNWNHTSHISEFRVSDANPDRADPASEQVILQVDQPQANHNAGALQFGPDGYLYVSLGDGGGAGDQGVGHTPGLGNGQDATNLLGSILRLDVSTPGTYTIPPDNPFIGTIGRDEIWAYGLRNPYRFSFDRGGNRDLFAADVGQSLLEEVNIVKRGGNYGWNIREGTLCFNPSNPNVPPPQCPNVGPLFGDPLLDPVAEYANRRTNPDGIGVSVIGGYMYRGGSAGYLNGTYVFGDWSSAFGARDGRLLVAIPFSRGLWPIVESRIYNRPNGRLGHYLLGFGEDGRGDVYVLTSDNAGPTGSTGRVYRIIPSPDDS